MTRIAVGGASPTGLQWPNYVNGRLLTAKDLSASRDAVLQRDRLLGLAIGSGVALGLEVNGSPGSSVLQVSPGTGVSPGGTAVHLEDPATLDLAAVSSAVPVDGALFADCRPATTSTKAPSAGAYVLAIRPASSYAGKVPVQGSPTAVLPTPCTSRWEVEDAVFVIIRLHGFTAPTTVANRRNLLAHWCYGSSALEHLAMSGFTEPIPHRGIDGLADLSPCDVPLGVFDWDGQALTFVDRWSARRRPVRPAAAAVLAAVVGDERTADGEARFLQFQEQLDGMLATPAGRSARALDVFPLLPPAGLVPISPIATARRLLPPQPVIAPKPTPAPTTPTFTLKELLLGPGAFAGAATSRLGALSGEFRRMAQDVAALNARVEDLTAKLGGATDKRQFASARAAGRRLAEVLVELLADTAGDGVDPARFFSDVPVRIGVVDHETVDFTVRRSWYDGPIELGRGAVLNLFFVISTDGEDVAPYLLFAKRQRGVRWIEPTPRVLDE